MVMNHMPTRIHVTRRCCLLIFAILGPLGIPFFISGPLAAKPAKFNLGGCHITWGRTFFRWISDTKKNPCFFPIWWVVTETWLQKMTFPSSQRTNQPWFHHDVSRDFKAWGSAGGISGAIFLHQLLRWFPSPFPVRDFPKKTSLNQPTICLDDEISLTSQKNSLLFDD